DHDLRALEPYEIARLGLGYVPEDRRIFTDLTVAENLAVGRPPPRAARLALVYCREARRIFTDLRVAETLAVGRQPPRAGAPAWSEEKLFQLFPALAPPPRAPGAPLVGRGRW